MRRVFKDEMDFVLNSYDEKIKQHGMDLLTKYSYDELKRIFAINYKNIMQAVVDNAKAQGKEKPQVSYCVLKLRRTIALWEKQGIILVGGGVHYSRNDYNNEFPLFNRQGFIFVPTIRTLKKLQSKVVKEYIDNHNKNVEKTHEGEYITNLNNLRSELKRNKKFTQEEANEIAKIYGEITSSQEIAYFSKTI